MGKRHYLTISAGCLVLLIMIGCGNSSNTTTPQEAGADIIQKYNFQVQGQPTLTTLTLPQQFTDANWGLKEIVCQQAGYDLTPYAGQDITVIKYDLPETHSGGPLYLIVLAKDQICICGYVVAANVIPGVYAVNAPSVK